MNVLCLCPTYGRPRLVANAVACFLTQDYPEASRKLLILDDAGQIESQDHGGWQVISTPERFPSLPAKYNAMLTAEGVIGPQLTSRWDAVAVWDDDDIYLPWHLTAAVQAMINNGAASAKPSQVWSLYNSETPWLENAAGRFHGSLVVGVPRLRELNGWIDTRRADFDQQMIAACTPVADAMYHGPRPGSPGYVFRWQSTKAPHCQGLMSSPDNEDWYERFQRGDCSHIRQFVPHFDTETSTVYNLYSARS